MDFAGIEYDQRVENGTDGFFKSPNRPAPSDFANMSGGLPSGPGPTGFHGPQGGGLQAEQSLRRRGNFFTPSPNGDTSPFPLTIPSSPTTVAHNEDSVFAPRLPARGMDAEVGGPLPHNTVPNNCPASTALEASAIPASLLPDRPNAPAFGMYEDRHRRLPPEPWSTDEPLNARRGPSPRESLAICEQCLSEQQFVSYCPACSFHFCRDHWDGQPLHHGQRLVNGVPHEKTDPLVAKKIKSIIEPSISEDEQNQLHKADDDTTWFGVLPDATDTGQRLFHDFGRYEEFLSQSLFSPKSGQFPSLISFVGPTGAGKSTIVKGLVKLPESGSGDLKQQTPVVGLVQHQAVPTSGEVHLYWDPSSLKSARPLLYADCEGLGGGSREPMAARATKEKKILVRERKNSNQSKHMSARNPGFRQSMPTYSSMSPRNTPMPPSPAPQSQSNLGYYERGSTPSYSPYSPVVEQNEGQDGWTPGSGKVYRGVTRNITWAQDRDRRSRQFIVENLYPRLLYTFSDIVVLVMRNPKSVLKDSSARAFC
jgi:energy-coupling factor transporter ATP-binding protein EcfA2